MRKSKILPLLPAEKSNQAIFWSLTKKEGVFSVLKGDSPLNSRPDRINLTRRRTTSDTGSLALISSRKDGGNRIGARKSQLADLARLVKSNRFFPLFSQAVDNSLAPV